MDFFTKETIETAIEKAEKNNEPMAFYITAYSDGVEPSYRIVRNNAGEYFNLISLDERQEPFDSSIQCKNLSIHQAIMNFMEHNELSQEEVCIYHTIGNRGLAQAMASRELLEDLVGNRKITKSDAIAIIGLAEKKLELPISVNGYFVKHIENTSPFFKMSFRGKESENDEVAYTMDISNIIKR